MSNLLSQWTTWGIGGAAKRIVIANSAAELIDLSQGALILGGGSNVLISDSGYDGTVVINRSSGIEFDGCYVTVDSGVMLPALCNRLCGSGLSGMEWASGIPGTVGGAVRMNAGAFGAQMSDVVVECTVLRGNGVVHLSGGDMGFAYRSSSIAASDRVITATLKVVPADSGIIRRRMREYSAIRSARQPTGRTAGSVFRNPTGMSVGKLIEQAGLKGYRYGGAEISEKHANFIVNVGGATARDVCRIIKKVKTVLASRGIEVSEEIIYIGEFD